MRSDHHPRDPGPRGLSSAAPSRPEAHPAFHCHGPRKAHAIASNPLVFLHFLNRGGIVVIRLRMSTQTHDVCSSENRFPPPGAGHATGACVSPCEFHNTVHRRLQPARDFAARGARSCTTGLSQPYCASRVARFLHRGRQCLGPWPVGFLRIGVAQLLHLRIVGPQPNHALSRCDRGSWPRSG